MNDATISHLVAMAAMTALKVGGPLLMAALVIGLLISLFQALTQINEATLTFLPKLVAMILVFWLLLPWISQELIGFTEEVFRLAAEGF